MQWKLGKPFLKKYTFLYDYDAKTVGFYNMDLLRVKKNKTISNIFLNIFYFIVICFFGYIGFFYGKKLMIKLGKKEYMKLKIIMNIKEKKKKETILFWK